jgi:hypothetical protein
MSGCCWLPAPCGGFGQRDRYFGLLAGTWLTGCSSPSDCGLYSHVIDSVTMPSYFEHRFNDKSRALRVVSADHSDLLLVLHKSGSAPFETVFGLTTRSPSWSALSQWFLTPARWLPGGSLDHVVQRLC